MHKGDRPFLGPSRIELLEAIAEHGSIVKAAKAVGISYKTAWENIETMNNLADAPLVERLVGGKEGGGTRLTAQGQQTIVT